MKRELLSPAEQAELEEKITKIQADVSIGVASVEEMLTEFGTTAMTVAMVRAGFQASGAGLDNMRTIAAVAMVELARRNQAGCSHASA